MTAEGSGTPWDNPDGLTRREDTLIFDKCNVVLLDGGSSEFRTASCDGGDTAKAVCEGKCFPDGA